MASTTSFGNFCINCVHHLDMKEVGQHRCDHPDFEYRPIRVVDFVTGLMAYRSEYGAEVLVPYPLCSIHNRKGDCPGFQRSEG